MVIDFNPIDPWSHGFVVELTERFSGSLNDLLAARRDRRRAGVISTMTLPVKPMVSSPDWRCSPPPDELVDRRIEITGPGVDPKMVLTALNSGAQGYMVDSEDSLSPTWSNVVATQRNLYAAVRRALRYEDRELAANPAVLHYRPRGLHMFEAHLEVDGRPVPASLFDFGLFVYWNAKELVRRGSAPYVYLPKLETEQEADWWDGVMSWTEARLGLPLDVIRCTVLVETLPGLLRLEPIVYELRDRLVGLNVGRWDYIFSCIKTLATDELYLLPDREAMSMSTPQLTEYARWVVNVAHRRGCHAIGGMAAHVPNRRDPVATRAAVEAVSVDKFREASRGHDGTWVAHPDLVTPAREAFDRVLAGRVEQREVVPGETVLDVATVMTPLAGGVTWQGIRDAARGALLYLDAWLGGSGCVAIDGKMEDVATAEISRALLWHWAMRGVVLEGGEWIGAERIVAIVRGETAALAAAGNEPRAAAVDLLISSITSQDPPEFITVPAYDILVKRV